MKHAEQDIEDAVDLEVGSSVAGSIGANGDTDWFAVKLTANTPYAFYILGNLGGGGTASHPALSLYNSAGSVMPVEIGAAGSGAELNNYMPQTTGTYYLVASGSSATAAGDYEIGAYDLKADIPGWLETQAVLTPNVMTSSVFETSQDVDGFKVTLEAGVDYWVNIDTDDAPGTVSDISTVFARAFDGEGEYVAEINSGFFPWQQTLNVETSGTYYIMFGNQGRTGAYDVTLTTGTPDAVGGTIATAHKLERDTPVAEQIDFRLDRDAYAVTMVAGATYEISLGPVQGSASDHPIGLMAQIINANGGIVVPAAVTDEVMHAVTLTYKPLTDGVYYVMVDPTTDYNFGSYRIEMSTDAPAEAVDPVVPVDPTEPVDPAEPVDPVDPVDPTEPVDPAEPVDPTDPVDPTLPVDPSTPVDPAEPVDPVEPVDPIDPPMALTGDSLADTLSGGSGDDLLQGLGGSDVLSGHDGADTLNAGNGDDTVFGGDGDDEISGSTGEDYINGGAGNDRIGGGENNDTLLGGDGGDEIFGGKGSDAIYGQDGDDNLSGGRGNDTIYGGNGKDIIGGGWGDDLLQSGDGDDLVGGGYGSDMIMLGAGDDTASGGQGRDTIYGGEGDDYLIIGGHDGGTLSGGTGNDTMVATTGADTFIFEILTAGENDMIRNFDASEDLIVLQGIVTGAPSQGLDPYDLITFTENSAGGLQISVMDHSILLDGYSGDVGADNFLFL